MLALLSPAIEFVTQQQNSAWTEVYLVTCGALGVNGDHIKSRFDESGFSLACELAVRRNGQYRLVALAHLASFDAWQNAWGLFLRR